MANSDIGGVNGERQGGVRVLGNSGCTVEVLTYNGRLAVRKTANSGAYAMRLSRQRMKQEEYRRHFESARVRVPQVLAFDDSCFTMEHLQMLDCVEFFERAAPRSIESRFRLVLELVRREQAQSAEGLLDLPTIELKLGNIERQVGPEIWLRHYATAAVGLRSMLRGRLIIPLGVCHGDLTLSNVMFSLDDCCIGLIDLLDSFVDSPLVDLAKLRQDTRFDWTTRRYLTGHDRAKVAVVNRWLDGMITETFGPLLRSPAFHVLEAMNYFRIAPYVRTDEDHAYLATTLAVLATSQND